MAQSHFASLEGTEVKIDSLVGPFRSCITCGHTTAKVSVEPVGTHCGCLVCDQCGGVTAWLGRDHLTAMLAQKRAEQKGAA